MVSIQSRLAKLEQTRDATCPRFLVVAGAGTDREALGVLAASSIIIGRNDMVFGEPGEAPPTVEIIPMRFPFEDCLAMLDVEGHAASAALKTIKGNHHVGAL